MRIDRRAFLGFVSASPFAFGLDELLAGTTPQEIPRWWNSALNRMKELDRPGLVFVGPTEDQALETLGFALRDLLESGDPRAREIFCASVVVCLHPSLAAPCLPEAAEPGRVVILDPKGQVVEKAVIPLGALANPGAFEEFISPLLYGEGDARLAAAAERVRSKLTAEEKAALSDLSSDVNIPTRERAARLLARRTDFLMPLLVFERRKGGDSERSIRTRSLIEAQFAASEEKSPGPRLPFGAKYKPGHGCASDEEDGSSIQCGMSRLEGKGQRFLKFLNPD